MHLNNRQFSTIKEYCMVEAASLGKEECVERTFQVTITCPDCVRSRAKSNIKIGHKPHEPLCCLVAMIITVVDDVVQSLHY